MTALTDEQLADLSRFVKPLEWRDIGGGFITTDVLGVASPIMADWDAQGQKSWVLYPDTSERSVFGSLDAAQAAAQTDYADMILSAAPDLLAEVVRLRGALWATAEQALREEIPERSLGDFDADEFNRGYDAAIRVARAALTTEKNDE